MWRWAALTPSPWATPRPVPNASFCINTYSCEGTPTLPRQARTARRRKVPPLWRLGRCRLRRDRRTRRASGPLRNSSARYRRTSSSSFSTICLSQLPLVQQALVRLPQLDVLLPQVRLRAELVVLGAPDVLLDDAQHPPGEGQPGLLGELLPILSMFLRGRVDPDRALASYRPSPASVNGIGVRRH